MLDLLENIHSHIFAPERLPPAIFAILLVVFLGLITGPALNFAAPLLWKLYDILFGRIGTKLDRRDRPAGDILFRGLVICVCALVLALLLVMGLGLAGLRVADGQGIEILALSLCLSAGSGWIALARLYRALVTLEVPKGAFLTLARSTRYNLVGMDEAGLSRAALKHVVMLFDKALVAPVFWYVLLGLPGAYIYTVLAALAWRFGHGEGDSGIGRAAQELEKLLGFVPGALAASFLALAALLTPTASFLQALKGLHFGGGLAPYFSGGQPLSVTAFALGIALGGAVTDLDGRKHNHPWTGGTHATAQIGPDQIRRALFLIVAAHLLFLAFLIGGIVIAGNV